MVRLLTRWRRIVAALALVVSVGPLLVLAAVANSVGSRALSQQNQAQVSATTTSMASSLQSRFQALLSEVRTTAAGSHLVDALRAGVDLPASRRTISGTMGLLRQKAAPDFLAGMLLDPQGRVIMGIPHGVILEGTGIVAPWFQQALASGTGLVAPPVTVPDGLAIPVAVPVQGDNGTPLGMVIGLVGPSNLQSLVANIVNGPGMGVLLLDPSRQVLTRVGAAAEGLENSPAAQAPTGAQEEWRGPNGLTLVAHATVPVAGWTVLTALPESALGAATDQLRSTLIVVAVSLAVILAAGVAGLLAALAALSRTNQALAQRESEIADLAATDPLTGLRNRLEFDRLCEHPPRQAFAVIAIDVDRLKPVNDELGHEAGDELLKTVAAALTTAVRAWDTLARIGGDEFVAVLLDADAAAAARASSRMLSAVRTSQGPGGAPSVSIGWAVGNSGDDLREVCRRADERMYEAKRDGRDRVRGIVSLARSG